MGIYRFRYTNGLDELLRQGLTRHVGELILVSGCYVPTKAGCTDSADLRRNGSRVRVLTNSFAATDVASFTQAMRRAGSLC